MWNQIKTVILLASLSGVLLFLGMMIGGHQGLQIALIMSVGMNIIAYFFSDKIVLSMYRAQPLSREQYGWIYEIVEDLAAQMKLPMPKLWFVPNPMANAFATGRNPSHASIAVTAGILDILDRDELRGVLAHELSHVKNRDILVSTIAATLASAIGYVANMLYYSSIFNRREENNKTGPLAALLISMLMPLAATIIQLAISRSREYLADETGAHACKDPLALAAALEKLQKNIPYAHLNKDNATQASTAPLFIVHPFMGNGWLSLFSTHPPMPLRIKKLQEIARKNF